MSENQNTVYRNTSLPVVFHGFGTWAFALREERRIRVYENRVLRRLYGPMREEVKGERRKLYNKEFYHLWAYY
jgi:hypothetical protein